MKRICIALAAVAMLFATSCKNNNEPENIVLGENEFYATIANDANPQKAPAAGDEMSPKTTIDPNRYVIWENSDQIYINGTVFTRSLSANKENVFATTGSVPTAPYYAFYAVQNPSTNSASATLPATQTYETDKVSNLPMYAYNQTSKALEFHNICAALKFKIPSSANGASKIEISAYGKALNGAFTVDANNKAVMSNQSLTAADTVVTIQKSSGTFATNEIVYVAIPAATYDNLTIRFYDSSNNEITDLTRRIRSYTLYVNKVYNIKYLSDGYFYIEAVNANSTVNFTKQGSGTIPGFNGLEYSTDGTNFRSYTIGSPISLTNVGDRVYFRAVATGNTILAYYDEDNDELYYHYFNVTGNVKAGGNVMYLLNQDGSSTFSSGSTFALSYIFSNQTALTDISNLSLPATTLADYCYYGMFSGCSGLTSIPEKLLPATTLVVGCYDQMFSGCTGLTSIPANLLPAQTLAGYCYDGMFYGCTGLTSIPANLLPATTLGEYCYYEMFSGCTSLTTAPTLPATTLAEGCYGFMFYSCTSLTTAPSDLPATTLAIGCYEEMFFNCTSLTTAPTLQATTLAERCCDNMFAYCKSLTTAPTLQATTLADKCYHSIFWGCENLSSVTMLATNVTASNCLETWLSGGAGSSVSGPTVYVNNSITSIASGAGQTIATNTYPNWSIKTQDGTHTLRQGTN